MGILNPKRKLNELLKIPEWPRLATHNECCHYAAHDYKCGPKHKKPKGPSGVYRFRGNLAGHGISLTPFREVGLTGAWVGATEIRVGVGDSVKTFYDTGLRPGLCLCCKAWNAWALLG